jgi:hypothetical protein
VIRIRIVGQPELHRRGAPDVDPRIWWTPCGIRYTPDRWPRTLARPPLPHHEPCRG